MKYLQKSNHDCQYYFDFKKTQCAEEPLPFYGHDTSVVFNAYWRFAQERQIIFYKKILSYPQPWTEDNIMETFKFTNAYRASDRVSQFLIQHVIYGGNDTYTPEDIVFRILLFKIFNKIETWQFLEKKLGDISFKNYSYSVFNSLLTNRIQEQPIYSAAYIMPSGKSSFGSNIKHQNHLHLLEFMMNDGITLKISKSKSLQELFEILLSYPTIGRFLAFQYAIDINYSNLTNFDEMSFIVAGPGAIRGIRKSFPSWDAEPERIIRIVAENQQQEFSKRGIQFFSLDNRQLQLIDCQNLFCEIDKYSRVAFPTINYGSGKRIKQHYTLSIQPKIQYYYPPKWDINNSFKDYTRRINGILLSMQKL